MPALTSTEVRRRFLDFFEEKGHTIEPSASLVPHEDPTLLWINSGVATMKKYFDGRVIPENPRLANAQKSIRTNDIENVGRTTRHHTFFEMLGNFSIGDYFKKEAIEWAWEFLTSERWIGFDENRLSVTVHPEDDEAYQYWREIIGLPEERVIRLEENFWDIGQGPSGPNTEIFYDRGDSWGNDPRDPEMYPGGENERYLEVWNLVFSQFNHNADDTYTPLPKKNIDTGMGLERLVTLVQDVPTNFDTDLFRPIIRKVEEVSGRTYGENEEQDIAFRLIADHVRTVSFSIGDGALPSNEGRGYILRRLLRRAVRYAGWLGQEEPFMHRLVGVVGEIMEDYYPEVREKQSFIERVVKTEEERFHETLADGLKMLRQVTERARNKGETVISGKDVFRLYDTYGFPPDLTAEYVVDEGFAVDTEEFEVEMEAQRSRARAARKDSGSMQTQESLLTDIDTESTFVGYEHFDVETSIQTLIHNKELVDTVGAGEQVQLILEKTPFYAESGGQVADRGTIVNEVAGVEAVVEDVQKAPNGQHLHSVRIEKGSLRKGMHVRASIEENTRRSIIKNHTATHLLHQALKDVLGEHVNQAGSIVTDNRLRFDFSHFGQVTEEEIKQIEYLVNEKVWSNVPVLIEEKGINEAKQMGATALFGEKYGERVRVVQIGDYSIELCGGCHVGSTSEVGVFKITGESGIGAGTRRIEAVTGQYAYEYFESRMQLLEETGSIVRARAIDDIPQRAEALQEQIRSLQKENESLSQKLSNLEAGDLADEAEEINGIPVIAKELPGADKDTLRQTVDELKQKLGSGIVVLGTSEGEKVQLIAGVTKDLTERYKAGDIVKKAAEVCGGGGGGRPDMAQAGGKQPEKLAEALEEAKNFILTLS